MCTPGGAPKCSVQGLSGIPWIDAFFHRPGILLKLKGRVLCGCEAWSIRVKDAHCSEIFDHWCVLLFWLSFREWSPAQELLERCLIYLLAQIQHSLLELSVALSWVELLFRLFLSGFLYVCVWIHFIWSLRDRQSSVIHKKSPFCLLSPSNLHYFQLPYSGKLELFISQIPDSPNGLLTQAREFSFHLSESDALRLTKTLLAAVARWPIGRCFVCSFPYTFFCWLSGLSVYSEGHRCVTSMFNR